MIGGRTTLVSGLVLTVVVAVVSGCRAGADDSMVGEDCPLPEFDDDIVLDFDGAKRAPGTALRVTTVGANVVACGDGFLAVAGMVGATPVPLAGRCTGLAVAPDDETAAAVTDTGQLTLFSVTAGGELTVLDALEDPARSFHDVVLHDGQALVAAGADGLLAFGLEESSLGGESVYGEASDARGVANVGAAILVADGANGIRLLDGLSGALIQSEERDGTAMRALARNERALVLRGANGFEVLEVDEAGFTVAASISPEGVALDARLEQDTAMIVVGSALLRFKVDDTGVTLLSREQRPNAGTLQGPWFWALADGPTGGWVSLGNELVPVITGDGSPSPIVGMEQATLSLFREEALLLLENLGAVDLTVGDPAADPPFFAEASGTASAVPDCPGQYAVAPGGKFLIEVAYAGGDDLATGQLTLATDDPDRGEFSVALEANPPGPGIGELAPEVELPTTEGAMFRLSDVRGKVLLMKIFNAT